ncbi:MAG: RING finger protein [Clostridia bacterium]
MSKFIGSICPVCEKEIQKEEEIVVCPICGAPYHRECYKIENKCLFENTLHQENKDYELKYPEKEKKENSQTTYDEYNQCPRCGAKNPSNGIYCNVCGSPLDTEFAKQSQQNGTQSPFNQIPYSPFGSPFAGIDPEEEIAGEKAKDITGIVKINTQYYLPVFKLIDGKRIKYKFNFSAFLFPSVYFLYRKVWYMAILSLVITLCLNSITFIDMFYYIATGLPAFNTTQTFSTVLSALSFFNFGYMIFCGFSAN